MTEHHQRERFQRRDLIARFPKESEARQQLGQVLMGEGQYEEARATLEQALELNPNIPQVHNTLSGVYLASKQFDRAVEEASWRGVVEQPGRAGNRFIVVVFIDVFVEFIIRLRRQRWSCAARTQIRLLPLERRAR